MLERLVFAASGKLDISTNQWEIRTLELLAGEVDQLGGRFVFFGTSEQRTSLQLGSDMAVSEPLGEWDPSPP